MVDHFVRMSLDGIDSGDVGVFMRTDVILMAREEEHDNHGQRQNSQSNKSSLLKDVIMDKAYCCMQ